MSINKDDFLKQMKKQFDDLNYKWSIERDKFEARAQHLSAEARKQFDETREEYRRVRKDMKEKMIDLEVASQNAWDDVKEGTENAWKAMSKAFDKASSHFKK